MCVCQRMKVREMQGNIHREKMSVCVCKNASIGVILSIWICKYEWLWHYIRKTICIKNTKNGCCVCMPLCVNKKGDVCMYEGQCVCLKMHKTLWWEIRLSFLKISFAFKNHPTTSTKLIYQFIFPINFSDLILCFRNFYFLMKGRKTVLSQIIQSIVFHFLFLLLFSINQRSLFFNW